jgi:hypothetical protein
MSSSSKLALVSMYQSQPVLGGHVIALELEEHEQGEMQGRISIDPNACTLAVWGDRGACTLMAPLDLEAQAQVMSTVDERGLGRVHWLLAMPSADQTINLIEDPGAKQWYLTIPGQGGIVAVVPLFSAVRVMPVATD